MIAKINVKAHRHMKIYKFIIFVHITAANRWDFMSCETDFAKSRGQTSNSSGKQLRCFKKRIIQQNKYSVQPYTDWGKKIYMIQNEVFQFCIQSIRVYKFITTYILKACMSIFCWLITLLYRHFVSRILLRNKTNNTLKHSLSY